MLAGSVGGPAYDMPTTMTKFLHLGMPLVEVIRAATSGAAACLGPRWLGEVGVGTLRVGAEADVAVLGLEACDARLEAQPRSPCRPPLGAVGLYPLSGCHFVARAQPLYTQF